MNPQSYSQDVAEINPGGYLFCMIHRGKENFIEMT